MRPEQEAVILRDGVALTASQIADARHIGIKKTHIQNAFVFEW